MLPWINNKVWQSLMMTYSKAKKKNQSKIEKDNYNTVLTDYGDDKEGEEMDDEEAQPQGDTADDSQSVDESIRN